VELVQGSDAAVVLTNLPTVVSSAGSTADEWRKARRRVDVPFDHLQLFQDVIDEICAAGSAVHCVQNVFPPSERGKGRYFIDHCHPTSEGYAQVAERIAAALRDQGLVPSEGAEPPLAPEAPVG
jgi:hypothetical protein